MGPPEVWLRGAPLALPSAKAQALLYYLAVTRRAHDRGLLAGLLWGGLPEDSARRNLRGALNQLRPALNDYLLADRHTVGINPDAPVWLDVSVLSAATGGDLRAAVGEYRGEFLQGFTVREAPEFEAWVTLQRERLRQRVLEARQTLAETAEAQGELALAIEDMRALLAIDGWREEAHRQLMRLLALTGRRSEALGQFETCRRLLAEELGIEPAAATLGLYEEIRTGRLAAVADQPVGTRPPPQPVGTVPANNLPAETTPFIGRQAELAQIAELLAPAAGCRLLTLFGPGGIGKTRLAMEAARQALPGLAEGVRLVTLEPVASPDLLVTALASALEVPLAGQADSEALVLAYLREREMLLVLDNFEHLVAGGALLVRLLEAAPGVRLLVTSREALNLYEETLLAVEGLTYPGEGDRVDPVAFDAVALFVRRARRVDLRFTLAGNEAAVAEICRLLSGMPLGLELAAAWVRTLPCTEIARELAANLDLPATSLRNVPVRHRSLTAAMDHSWQLLRPDERQRLRRLAVFRGGFSASAALEVAGADRRDLSTLADKALVTLTAAGRYDLHPLLRQFAADKLAAADAPEEADCRARHTVFFAARLAELEAAVKGRDQRQALQWMAGELDNLRAAWAAAVGQRQVDRLEQMAEALFHFYGKRGLQPEGALAFGQAVAVLRPEGPAALLAKLLVRQGRLSEHISQDFAVPAGLFMEGLALARQEALPVECAQALMGLGLLALMRGHTGEAEAHLTESLAVCRRADVPWTLANVLVLLAWLDNAQGRREQAEARCREAIDLHRANGDQNGVAAGLTALGKICADAGELDRAEAAYGEALELCRQSGHRVGQSQALTGLFATTYRQGDLARARAYAGESLALNREVGDRLGMAITTHNLGTLSAAGGQQAEAIGHFQAALALYRSIDADPARLTTTQRYLAESLLAVGEVLAAAVQLHEVLRRVTAAQPAVPGSDLLLTCARLLASLGENELAKEILMRLRDAGALPVRLEPRLALVEVEDAEAGPPRPINEVLADAARRLGALRSEAA